MTGWGRHHRHERWLHARISAELEEALRREAQRRRSPISLVVRNILESALDLVEDLVDDGFDRARSARARRPSNDDVYGWQEIILNRDARCAHCDADLEPGAPAYRGLSDRPGTAIFQCPACVRNLAETKNNAAFDQREDSDDGQKRRTAKPRRRSPR